MVQAVINKGTGEKQDVTDEIFSVLLEGRAKMRFRRVARRTY